jgi:hypothetical protein
LILGAGLAASLSLAVLVSSASGDSTTNPADFPSTATVVRFDEVPLLMNDPVTDQFEDLGVTFESDVYFAPQGAFPGTDASNIGNYNFATDSDCAGNNPVTLHFTTDVTGVGFNAVTNDADDVQLQARAVSGGTVVGEEAFTTSLDQPYFVGLLNLPPFEELVITIFGTSNSCFLMDNLMFVEEEPTPTPTPRPLPTARPQVGGGAAGIVSAITTGVQNSQQVFGADPTAVGIAPPSTGTGVITPPSTGDAGLEGSSSTSVLLVGGLVLGGLVVLTAARRLARRGL